MTLAPAVAERNSRSAVVPRPASAERLVENHNSHSLGAAKAKSVPATVQQFFGSTSRAASIGVFDLRVNLIEDR